jgi:hypothetical protein
VTTPSHCKTMRQLEVNNEIVSEMNSRFSE